MYMAADGFKPLVIGTRGSPLALAQVCQVNYVYMLLLRNARAQEDCWVNFARAGDGAVWVN